VDGKIMELLSKPLSLSKIVFENKFSDFDDGRE
jgi:hypothetical protein